MKSFIFDIVRELIVQIIVSVVNDRAKALFSKFCDIVIQYLDWHHLHEVLIKIFEIYITVMNLGLVRSILVLLHITF